MHTHRLTHPLPPSHIAAGAATTTYDFCVHPEAAALAQGNEGLRGKLMALAAEAVAQSEGKAGWRLREGGWCVCMLLRPESIV